MTSKDQLLLEQAYKSMLIEQQRLIEEGKIWDFIKGMGNKLKNAWDVINVKLISNPKLYKGLVIAGPIIASLIAKNFQNTEISSDAVKSLLETLNGVDPNINTDDLSNLLTQWDHDHAASFAKITNTPDGNNVTSTLDVADNHNGQYSVSGSTLTSNNRADKVYPSQPGEMVTSVNKEQYVQTVSQSLQSLTTSDLNTVIKDFTSEVTKVTNTDGSGGSSLVSYTGVVTASSPEEAMKIVSELLKSAIDKSGIDIKTLNIGQPQATLVAAESLYRINPAEYLLEFAALDKFKSAVKNTANKVVAGVKSIVVGAQALAAQIKSTFKKQPNAPEQQYKVNLQVTIPQQQAQPKA